MLPILLAIALATPQAALSPAGRTLDVGERAAFSTLAEAVAAAVAGDTIRLAAGRHDGGVRVDRRLVLIGARGAVVDGRGRGTVLRLEADSIEVRGLTIRGSGRSLDTDDAAVQVLRCRDCRVVGNRIERALHGIYLLESRGVLVADNVIDGDPALDESRRGNGVHLFHSAGNRIERNAVRGTRDGIYFSFADGNDVVANRVSGVRYGLHYMYSNDNRFTGNDFRRNAAGAAVMFSHRIELRDNTFAEHVGHRAFGMLLQSSTRIVAAGNRITGNLIGLYLDNALHNRFTSNVIAGNGVGIDLLTSAEGNTFTGNAIVDNRVAVRTSTGAGENRWSEGGRGNWWGDPAVFDLDGDGVGDRPYRASDPFASLAQRRPVLEVFAGTLAARSLAWAERAFPVFELPAVDDPAPLVRPPDGLPGSRERSAR